MTDKEKLDTSKKNLNVFFGKPFQSISIADFAILMNEINIIILIAEKAVQNDR